MSAEKERVMNKKSSGIGIRKSVLLRTNLLVCVVIMLGFALTTVVSYRANQDRYYKDMESVTLLTSEGIYHEIDTIFTKPINISITMANDNLLKDLLNKEQEDPDGKSFLESMRGYLSAYREQYAYDSVFLASSATERYYTFNGMDRTLEAGNPENVWFHAFLAEQSEYNINIDNDEVEGAGDSVTVFINARIKDADEGTMGIVGVGFRVDSLQSLLESYERDFGVTAHLIDESGELEIATDRTAYEGNIDFFEQCSFPALKDQILQPVAGAKTFWHHFNRSSGYVVSRYIPNLSGYLIVEQDTTAFDAQLTATLCRDLVIIALVIGLVLITITGVIRRYNKRIIDLTVEVEKQHRSLYQKAAEKIYENIYEIDITHNCAANEETARYFESLGAPPNTPFAQLLKIIAAKQVKEEYRQGYIDTLSPENALKAFESGTENLRYDLMITNDGYTYYWARITAHLFIWGEDNSVRMLTYRENIDAQKKRELYLFEQMQKDCLTDLLNKAATQEKIRSALAKKPDKVHAFLIMDIDNFKEVNDRLGHAAGDAVLIEFAKVLKAQFGDEDIIGRIGGDEFVAFVQIDTPEEAKAKASSLSAALHRTVHDCAGEWLITSSIGVALAPYDGLEFKSLYKKADLALYETKEKGKNGFTLYNNNLKSNEP